MSRGEAFAREESAVWQEWPWATWQDCPPLAVEIQPTARCHRRCIFCSHWMRNRTGADMSADQVKSLLDELRTMGTTRIAFSGGGEPLIWGRGSLPEAVVQASGFAVTSVTTSGDQLWDQERGCLAPDAAIYARHCSQIFVNVPAVDDAGFSALVKGSSSSWARTRSVLSGMVGLADRTSAVMAVVVVSENNVEAVAKIDRTLGEIGVDGIYYKPPKVFEDRVNAPGMPRPARAEAILVGAGGAPGGALAAFVAQSEEMVPAAPCWVNRLGFNAVVDPQGDVYACTPTVGQRAHCIGNIGDSGFGACWSGARRREVVTALDRMAKCGDCSQDCRELSRNVAIEARVAGRREGGGNEGNRVR